LGAGSEEIERTFTWLTKTSVAVLTIVQIRQTSQVKLN